MPKVRSPPNLPRPYPLSFMNTKLGVSFRIPGNGVICYCTHGQLTTGQHMSKHEMYISSISGKEKKATLEGMKINPLFHTETSVK